MVAKKRMENYQPANMKPKSRYPGATVTILKLSHHKTTFGPHNKNQIPHSNVHCITGPKMNMRKRLIGNHALIVALCLMPCFCVNHTLRDIYMVFT